tara:strand:- start:9234 stop:10118 length:885 start_codon:yes stop_codon:yes gene_type:complete
MKTLLVNGCSWTYGGGLDRPSRKNQFNFPYEPGTKEHMEHLHDKIVWPAHVKKLMNFDRCVNLAEGCGSNQRICRTTFDWVNQQDEETLKNTTVIIQWSCEDRYEYYVPTKEESVTYRHGHEKRYQVSPMRREDIWHEQTINDNDYDILHNLDRWAKVNPHGIISFAENHNDPHVIRRGQSRYETYTDQEGMYTWLFHMGFLYDFLNSKGIECYYWYFNQYVVAMPQEVQDYIYDRFPMLEKDPLGFQTRCHLYNYERIGGEPDDPHPSVRGHEQIGQYIVNDIAKKKTILRRP